MTETGLKPYIQHTILVFGSNSKGIHGKGAADWAKRHWGAVNGVSEGPTGRAYVLPTRNVVKNPRTGKLKFTNRSLEEIDESIDIFLQYAHETPHCLFILTPVGTGLAGFTRKQIMSIIKKRSVPSNVVFSKEWMGL